MNFQDTTEEASFRTEVKAWLEEATKEVTNIDFDTLTTEERVALSQRWQVKKHAAGFAAITLPKEMGGRGGTAIQQSIYAKEEKAYDLPDNYLDIGLNMCVPTLLTHGRNEVATQERVEGIFTGKDIWCQLFSEPAAGSDLAGIRTRSVQDGDDWIINGQKVWTSRGNHADYAILVTRSDPSVSKHKGLTYFYVDMKSPGIEVRTIKLMDESTHFCEVFLTDVRIPDSQRLGEIGQGWMVAMTTLLYERQSAGEISLVKLGLDNVIEVAKQTHIDGKPAIEDSGVIDKLADWYLDIEGLHLFSARNLTNLSRGGSVGSELSMNKLVEASAAQNMSAYCMDLMEAGGVVKDPTKTLINGDVQSDLLWSPGMRIAGGTDEILKNIIAERVLGLPQELRTDKNVPFKDLK